MDLPSSPDYSTTLRRWGRDSGAKVSPTCSRFSLQSCLHRHGIGGERSSAPSRVAEQSQNHRRGVGGGSRSRRERVLLALSQAATNTELVVAYHFQQLA